MKADWEDESPGISEMMLIALFLIGSGCLAGLAGK
jgi:hypothetical protein